MRKERISLTEAKQRLAAGEQMAVRSTGLLDAAEQCNALAMSLSEMAKDSRRPQQERLNLNQDRITLWSASLILKREASNDKLCREQGGKDEDDR